MAWFRRKREKVQPDDPKEIRACLGRNQEHAVDSGKWQVVIRMCQKLLFVPQGLQFLKNAHFQPEPQFHS